MAGIDGRLIDGLTDWLTFSFPFVFCKFITVGLLITYSTHPSSYNTFAHRFLQVSLHDAVPVTLTDTIFGAESITMRDSAHDGNTAKYRILRFHT